MHFLFVLCGRGCQADFKVRQTAFVCECAGYMGQGSGVVQMARHYYNLRAAGLQAKLPVSTRALLEGFHGAGGGKGPSEWH